MGTYSNLKPYIDKDLGHHPVYTIDLLEWLDKHSDEIPEIVSPAQNSPYTQLDNAMLSPTSPDDFKEAYFAYNPSTKRTAMRRELPGSFPWVDSSGYELMDSEMPLYGWEIIPTHTSITHEQKDALRAVSSDSDAFEEKLNELNINVISEPTQDEDEALAHYIAEFYANNETVVPMNLSKNILMNLIKEHKKETNNG